MKKSNVMPSVVLGAICLISALLLSVINMFTAPEIEKNKKEAEIKALKQITILQQTLLQRVTRLLAES